MSLNCPIILKEGALAPSYQTEGSAGADISAYLPSGPFTLTKGSFAAIPTGIFVEIPKGYEIQVRPRSGLAFKYGVTVLNAPGTIDSDYRGEIKVVLINHSDKDFIINDGDRIAQLVFAKYTRADYTMTDKLSETDRGNGGFGSTGV